MMARTCIKSKPVEFKLSAPQAKRVSLAGTFNKWSTRASMRKDARGLWKATVSLDPGRYEYKFVVDGNWMNDPACSHNTCNSFGTQNSVLEVR